MKTKNIISKIFSIIFIVILIVILIKAYDIYKSVYFNDFIKGEYQNLGTTEFLRDNKVKYSKYRSYKIESKDFNDVTFYKEIEVKPKTSYRVSCMVKTEDVEVEKSNSDAGAMISLIEESEVSNSIRGTNDWQELTMVFNSKAREKVKIGFRLGGNMSNAKGKAWFSDLKLEEGTASHDTKWKMACFIFKNIDVNIDNKQYKFNMSFKDVYNIKSNVQRFTRACKELSDNKMTAECDIYEIDEPITTISYDEEHLYYIDPQDVRDKIGKTVLDKEYDYVFVAVRMGNEYLEIPVKDWIGLGSMRLFDIGYSIIRLPNDSKNLIYQYDSRINQFPEEVYVHEFLHTLERNLQDYDYKFPTLHDNEKYGYKDTELYNLKYWYRDYMKCKIIDRKANKYVGLDEIVYSLKPAHNSDFKYSIPIELENEPKNIIEEIRAMFGVLGKLKNIIQVEKSGANEDIRIQL